MTLSRRRLLAGVVGAAAATLAGGGAWLLRGDLEGGVRRLYHRFSEPPLPHSAAGELDAETAAVLAAAAEALVGAAGRGDRYLAPFRWRAAHLPGHLELYRRFTRFVDAGARRAGAGRRFAALPPPRRRALLAGWFPGGRLRHLALGWAAPERMRFRLHVVHQILAVYADTDAWTDLGYDGWPGEALGLDAYRRRPPGAAER